MDSTIHQYWEIVQILDSWAIISQKKNQKTSVFITLSMTKTILIQKHFER